MIYTHVLNRRGRGVRSPLDRLRKTMGQEGGVPATVRKGEPDVQADANCHAFDECNAGC